ncbi:tight adherance operon protein, partial [Escherichia coli]|nr:tight adherance operon protein [Escherichia coli]
MLLFPQKDDKSTVTEKIFFVCSAREKVCTTLSEMLRAAGFSHVKCINQDLLKDSEVTFPENAAGVIIDVEKCDKSHNVTTIVQAVVPREVWCCVVGDSDSISLAQSFSRQGIFYFNAKVQTEELVTA